jgi:hypothetical protein
MRLLRGDKLFRNWFARWSDVDQNLGDNSLADGHDITKY